MTPTLTLPQLFAHDRFAARLQDDGQTLVRDRLRTLQLNLGKQCNQACHHCHVEAGPQRQEVMTWAVMQRVLDWIDRHQAAAGLEVVDLTGGAPELNPHFRQLVVALRQRGLQVLDRCNLTILLEPDQEDLGAFLAEQAVGIVASLPCYLEENVDAQRGAGVFADSILALQQLNALGYGADDGKLTLDLVYNPVGYGLPPAQGALEAAYKEQLAQRFGIRFNRLFALANMPIRRFAHALARDGKVGMYQHKLETAHRPGNVASVMCRSLVSVGWQGSVYDCDFNQMLQMPVEPTTFGLGAEEALVERDSRKLWEYELAELCGRAIRTGSHCFGCTAGEGSSCTGALQG